MRLESDEKLLLRLVLLKCVRDQLDRVQIRPSGIGHFEMIGFRGDQHWTFVPPPQYMVPLFPRAVAGFEPFPRRLWWALSRWFFRRMPHVLGGWFFFPIGSDAISVEYTVRWSDGSMIELEIRLELAPALAQAADAELRRLFSMKSRFIEA